MLFISAERLGVLRFSLWVEDLNLEGAILFPCVAELVDFTDLCDSGENLLMAREEIPELLMLVLDVRSKVDFTRDRDLTVVPEE